MPSATLRVNDPAQGLEPWGEAVSGPVSPRAPHLLTCTIVGWLPGFTRPETVQVLLDSWPVLPDLDLLAQLSHVVLENQGHFISSADDLAKDVGDFMS
ncbi:MAG: hypothetical protein U0790_01645 [Isosphaeraceae bacterium]